jgi:hypothetical protein
MNRFTWIVFFLAVWMPCSIAQVDFCGTHFSEAQRNLELSGASGPYTSPVKLNKTLSVTVHVVRDQFGATGVIEDQINSAIEQLTNDFAPVGLSFTICDWNYIDNYHLNSINLANNQDQALRIQHYKANTINLYFVSTLQANTSTELMGVTWLPADDGNNRDAIILSKAHVLGPVLTHQVGHFFGLYHTHETTFGNERADGSNCATAGDLCCDTPADPNLLNMVDDRCEYTLDLKDANGQSYVPTTVNYMSFSRASCTCMFSDEQYTRVLNNWHLYKQHLW